MQVEIGKIYEGTVKNITKYGAFVEIPNPDGDKIMGMVHISEVSRSYVNEIRDFVTEGQQVRVKAIGTNPQGKISLSMKQAEEGAEQHGQRRGGNHGERSGRPSRGNGDAPHGQQSRPPRRSKPNVWEPKKRQEPSERICSPGSSRTAKSGCATSSATPSAKTVPSGNKDLYS